MTHVLDRQDTVTERPPTRPPVVSKWQGIGLVLVLAVLTTAAVLAVVLAEGEPASAPPGDALSELVLGARHQGVAAVPEYVGLSGGDLPVVESSPLVLGARHLTGAAGVPEFVGLSGGDAPATESSPMVIGTRHLEGAAAVPEYVGSSETGIDG